MDPQAQGGGVTHRCDFCEEAFATQEELEQHVKEQHGDAGDLSVPEGTVVPRPRAAPGWCSPSDLVRLGRWDVQPLGGGIGCLTMILISVSQPPSS